MDALREPTLFELEDLKGDSKPGVYYKEQLKLAPDPKDNDYWEVEKILKTKKVKGKTLHFCKFLYYPGIYYYNQKLRVQNF